MTEQELIDELIALPSYIISGVVMALAYTNEDSIATSIIAHMTNNFIAFVQAFFRCSHAFYQPHRSAHGSAFRFAQDC